MSTTSSEAQEAAEASYKRKREEAEDADAKVVERKYIFDLDILDCPICVEPFSPPVYQCHNGHTACSACCTKLISMKCPSCTLPTGSIRCIAVEKLVKSLLVSCKYARHGCEVMRTPSGIGNHEAGCENKPFRCPVPKCNYEAPQDPLRWHLTEGHRIETEAEYNFKAGVSFKMEPSDRIVMVNVDYVTPQIYFVHRKVYKNLGDVFFCTSFGRFDVEKYNLTVWHGSVDSVPHSMKSAKAIGLRCMKEYLNNDFLLVPGPRRSLDVNFKLIDFYNN